jgi:sulfate transport system permease protein
MRVSRRARLSMRAGALLYLAILLLLPLAVIFGRTFEHGLDAFWSSITTPAAISAFWLTVTIAAIAVPLNTIFGIGCALLLVRGRGRGRGILDALVDVPFVVSPVIIGLSLVLVYGKDGWFGKWFIDHGLPIIYQPAGMVLATMFVSLPFVVREVVPVLIEVGDEQEQAAATLGASGWQTFWRVTLPSIRWGVAYGVVLATARSLGEFGAVSVVSSKVAGSTLTLPLLVDARYSQLDDRGAYAAATLLAGISLVVLLAMIFLAPGRRRSA